MTRDFVEDAAEALAASGQAFLVVQVGPRVAEHHNDGREYFLRFGERGRQDVRALLSALDEARADLEKLL